MIPPGENLVARRETGLSGIGHAQATYRISLRCLFTLPNAAALPCWRQILGSGCRDWGNCLSGSVGLSACVIRRVSGRSPEHPQMDAQTLFVCTPGILSATCVCRFTWFRDGVRARQGLSNGDVMVRARTRYVSGNSPCVRHGVVFASS